MKVAIVGVGNMGNAFAKALAQKNVAADEDLLLFEPNTTQCEELRKENVGTVFESIGPEITKADVVMLAVKPQVFEEMGAVLRKYLTDDQLIISIMAGVTVKKMSDVLGVSRIVRAMPNTPCQLGLGISGFYVPDEIKEHSKKVELILASTGKAVQVATEEDVDSVTAISGSGPAYIYLFLEGLVQSGEKLGLTREMSLELATQTMAGAHALVVGSDKGLGDLIAAVTSKGGTTEAALSSLREDNWNGILEQALVKAKQRAVELSK